MPWKAALTLRWALIVMESRGVIWFWAWQWKCPRIGGPRPRAGHNRVRLRSHKSRPRTWHGGRLWRGIEQCGLSAMCLPCARWAWHCVDRRGPRRHSSASARTASCGFPAAPHWSSRMRSSQASSAAPMRCGRSATRWRANTSGPSRTTMPP